MCHRLFQTLCQVFQTVAEVFTVFPELRLDAVRNEGYAVHGFDTVDVICDGAHGVLLSDFGYKKTACLRAVNSEFYNMDHSTSIFASQWTRKLHSALVQLKSCALSAVVLYG